MARTKSQVKRASQTPTKKRQLSKPDHPALDKPAPKSKKSSKRSSVQLKTKNKRPFKMGARALLEIRNMQKSTELLIPKLPFSRITREVMMCFTGRDLRITRDALMALQESAEAYLSQFFEDAYLLSFHAKRVTLMAQDMVLLKRLRGRLDPCN